MVQSRGLGRDADWSIVSFMTKHRTQGKSVNDRDGGGDQGVVPPWDAYSIHSASLNPLHGTA